MGRQKEPATTRHGPKPGNFVASNGKAKSPVVAQIVRIAHKERLDDAGFIHLSHRKGVEQADQEAIMLIEECA